MPINTLRGNANTPTGTAADATPTDAAGTLSTAATTAANASAETNAAATASDRFDQSRVRQPVDVLFTPNDDAYAYETQCIDQVLAARRADPVQYSAEDNPYRILYMVFNLRNKEIVDKLTEAANSGVEVQVLVEADQISDARPWNKVDEWFEEKGLSVLRSDKDVDLSTRAKTHLIGIDKRSLMHMKSRIFRYRDPDSGEMVSKVLSGSLNPGGTPVLNEENVNIFSEDRIVDEFEKRFYEVRSHTPTRNTWDDDQPVNVLFTPYHQGGVTPTQKLFEWIDQENEMILISVFALRNLKTRGERDSLIDKLKKAMDRDVPVMVITDRRKSDGTDENGERIEMYGRPAHDDPTDEAMEAAGIPVIELVNTSNPFASVHGKSALFGLSDMKVMTGAGNWTVAAMGSDRKDPRNEESFLFIESGKLDKNYTARCYLANFLGLLRKYDNQYSQQAEDLVKKLQQSPSWPKVPLDLSAVAQANQGSEVYLVTDHPELQDRIPDGAPGVPIDTSPSASSPPFRPADPISLPFGSLLSYRVATRKADGELQLNPGEQVVVVDTEH